MTEPHRTAQRLRRALALVGVVVVLLVGFTGYQALKAKTALERTASDFDTLRTQLTDGDEVAARATLAQAQRNATEAKDNSHGLGWWMSGRLPQLGPNIKAIQVITGVADSLAHDVLPGVISASSTLSPQKLRPVDGRIDLEPIRAGAPAVMRASAQLSREADRVDAIDAEALAPQIGQSVSQLQAKLTRADNLADRAARAMRLLPAMLGADGERRYLFMFQNNAEIRSTGGIPGGLAVVTAKDGKLALGRQGDAGSIGRFDRPPTPLTPAEQRLFGRAMGVFPQDVNVTPDFPRSATLLAGMWSARHHKPVDGVVSVDPVALSYLLRGTGPVRLPDGRRLTAANAVDLLLRQVYVDIADPAQQNDFFNAAARKVFEATTSGAGRPRSVLTNLARGASERRVLMWSSREEEQRVLAPTAIAGRLPTRATTTPEVGLYLNASRAYKLDYFLDYRASVDSIGCQDARQHLRVRVRMHSRVPADVTSLPSYVAPPAQLFGRGTIVATMFFVAPVDGTPTAYALDGREEKFDTQKLSGRVVFARSVALKPGQTHTVTIDVLTGKGQTDPAHFQITPGVRSTGLGDVGPSAC
ncbi:MAG: DUF4012 domain-containing protein [Nocardioidaceae bacterium]